MLSAQVFVVATGLAFNQSSFEKESSMVYGAFDHLESHFFDQVIEKTPPPETSSYF